MIYRISIHCASKPKTANKLLYDLQNPQQYHIDKQQQQQQQQQKYSSQPNPIVKTQNSQCHHVIPTHVSKLDSILRGGIRLNSITEVVGEAGVGKTQLVMQLAVTAAAQGMGTIYIDTERKLSLQRLREIATGRYNNYNNSHRVGDEGEDGGGCADGGDHHSFIYNDENENENENEMNTIVHDGDDNDDAVRNDDASTYKPPMNVLNNVSVHTPNSTAELVSVISKLQEEIAFRNYAIMEDESLSSSSPSSYPVKLIILDSIAAPTRRDFGGDKAMNRVNAIFQIAQMLKQIGDEMNVAIVVINQIEKVMTIAATTDMNNGGSGTLSSVKAALGTSWHHCVSTRILLEHESPLYLNEIMSGKVRKATIVKSNLVGCASVNYEITGLGICQM